MIVKPHPVQRLESVDEVGALLVGDFINAKLPDGFDGEICLIGNGENNYGVPVFGRMAKNGNGNYAKIYDISKVKKIIDGKMIVSEAKIKDIWRASPKYYWLKQMLTKCEINDNWEYAYG